MEIEFDFNNFYSENLTNKISECKRTETIII